MHEELISRIRKITASLKVKDDDYKELAGKISRLQSENDTLKGEKALLGEKIRQLREEILLAKSSVAPLDEKDKKHFEKRINEYLRAIDKSISLLQS